MWTVSVNCAHWRGSTLPKYKTVLIIFPLNLQTITITLDVVKWRWGGHTHTTLGQETGWRLYILPIWAPSGILCGWTGSLEPCPFCTYTVNFQKHAQDTSFLTFLLHWLTVSRVRAANFVRRPCSDSSHFNEPYKFLCFIIINNNNHNKTTIYNPQ